MRCSRPQSCADVLYWVFVQPYQATYSARPAQWSPRVLSFLSRRRDILLVAHKNPAAQIRQYGVRRRPNNEPPRRIERAPVNEAIGTHYVNFVDTEGSFHPVQPIRQVLQTFDRETHSLVLLQPGNSAASEFEKEHWPTTKIMSKREILTREKEGEQRMADQKRLIGSAKTIELNWAISEHDLGHRLKKAKTFLTEGRKVEIMLASKKGSRSVTSGECRRLVDAIESELEQVEGAKESKPSEGQVGKMMALFWQGKRQNKDQLEE